MSSVHVKEQRVFVSDAPVIVRGPNTTSAIKNDRVTLDCKANGNPRVSYEWYRVGASLTFAVRCLFSLSQ